jgi:hypothetical protein
METSPLRFLDYDVSQMLGKQVRCFQEEHARRFHSYNFENSHEINLNNRLHYKISDVFDNNPTLKNHITGEMKYVVDISKYINIMLREY